MTEATQSRPTPRAGIMEIEAYVPGKSAAAPGVSKIHKLSSNETPLGPSPAAWPPTRGRRRSSSSIPTDRPRAARRDRRDLWPQPGPHRLWRRVRRHPLPDGAGFIGHGEEAHLHRAWISGLSHRHPRRGGRPVVAPETDDRADVDAILSRVTAKTRVVFIANPNNPTGTYIPFDEVRRLHAGLPSDVILVLDAAYSEYVRKNDYESGIELVATADNVVMTRTFSKIHGLAGLRIGWCYAPADDRRCAQPHPRAVQRILAGDRSRGRRPRRSRPRRAGRRPQRVVVAEGNRGA